MLAKIGSHHLHKKNFTHSFWLNLMMAAMLNSTMLDSDTLFSSLRLTQKHSPSTLTLTQTNLIRLKLIHSHSTWWWWPSWIVPSWIQLPPCWIWTPCFFLSGSLKNTHSTLTLTQTNSMWLKLIHSHSTWWWWPSWIVPSWIQLPPCWIWTPCFFLSGSLKKTLTPLWLWLKLIQCDSNSFILTQLDDGGHLELCHLGFSFHHVWFGQLVFFSQIHSKTLTPLWLWLKLIQCDSNSFILTQLDDGGHLEFCHLELCHLGFSFHHVGFRQLVFFSQIHSKRLTPLWLWLKLIQCVSNSFILTQLDDGGHLEFCHVGFSFCHVGFGQLVFFSQIHSKRLSLHSYSDSN